ncbi:MAG: hypothetical protein FWB73_00450 [Treponema sp.]|nr:hypothetical protein [Treponema sp.]
MPNLSTAALVANEIAKAVDFSFANDQSINNIAVALRAILTGENTDYVIGGSVLPYPSGGMNFIIAPIYGHCKASGIDVIDTDTTPQPTSLEAAHAIMDRYDTVQIRGIEKLSDYQLRKFKDPETGVLSTENIPTKKHIELEIMVKKGADGSVTAPLVDNGWVKLAEIFIPAGTVSITSDHINNITARAHSQENTAWTIEKSRTFNPGYLSEIIAKFLHGHNEDGTHKNNAIEAAQIKFGIEEKDVSGKNMPTGKSIIIRGESFTSQISVTTLIEAISMTLNAAFPYVNNVLGRFSYIDDFPVATSTENINITNGGEMVIDGIVCTVGQLILLKDQTNKKENGLWEVKSDSWLRYTGYTNTTPKALTNKFILIKNGNVNAKKIYILKDGESCSIGTTDLEFIESTISPSNVHVFTPLQTEDILEQGDHPTTKIFQNIIYNIQALFNNFTKHNHAGENNDAQKITTNGIKDLNVTCEKIENIAANTTSTKATFSTTPETFKAILQKIWQGITWHNNKLNASSGHKHTGGTDDAPRISVAALDYPIGWRYEQKPNDLTPSEAGFPGTWEIWNKRAEIYELITEAQYTSLFSSVPTYWTSASTISANQWRVWTPGEINSVGTMVNGSSTSGTRRILRSNKAVSSQNPLEMNPIDWDDIYKTHGYTIRRAARRAVQSSWTASDLAIGAQVASVVIDGVTYTNMRVIGILTPAGTFPSYAGGNRPPFISGGFGRDESRKIHGSTGQIVSTGELINSGALNMEDGGGSTPYSGGNIGKRMFLNIDSSLVVPTGRENSPYTISTQLWRRVS